MKTIISTKFFAPFNEKNKPSLKILNKKFSSGVYYIKERASNRIVYIGLSQSNLYRTIYRHFYYWQQRNWYSKDEYLIKIIFTTPAQAIKLEKFLILKYKKLGQADDNYLNYSLDLTDAERSSAKMDLSNPIIVSPDEDYPF